MKKLVLALSLVLFFSSAALAEDAVFESMDSVSEVQKVKLAPVSNTTSTPAVNTLSGSIQEESFKKAITNLDDASAEIREQLINYNSQLATVQAQDDQLKAQIKELKKQVKQTKKKLKNIEKSKKYINSNFDNEQK